MPSALVLARAFRRFFCLFLGPHTHPQVGALMSPGHPQECPQALWKV